jgi:hypothetical protein
MNRRVCSTSAEKICLLFVICGTFAAAQDAQISGLIFDPSNASVARADIALRNEQTGGRRTARSNDSGFYNLSALRPGMYRLTVRAAGFETVVREGVVLEVGQSARLDFDLQLGGSQTTINVSSGPPLVNVEDAGVGTVIDRKLIDQMPLNGRGIQTLIELAPGVNALPVTNASRGQFSINGQRSDANYFTVDGISANFAAGNSNTVNAGSRLETPATIGQAGGGMLPANNFLGTFSNLLAPEALQEFKIQTSTYAPEFGHAPGGQIDLVSRSGGNRYSGSLFEYLRNDKTDANDWFNNAQAISKPPLRFNNFGGTFGGPVRFGRRYDGRNRTFFFLSVDQLLVAEPQPLATSEVPNFAARQNAPAALAPFLSFFPLPNGAAASDSGSALYTGATSRLYKQGSYGLRVDHSFVKDINFFARINHAPSTRDEPIQTFATPSNREHYSIDTDAVTLGVTKVFTSSLVNELRFGASRQSTTDHADLDTGAGARNPGDGQLFPPGFSSLNSSIEVQLSSASSVYLGLVQKNQASQLEWADNLFYARGSHRWKFGADYQAFRIANVEPIFEGLVRLPSIYNADGSFISTASSALSTSPLNPKTAYLEPSFFAYAQDTWRISDALTVTYGFRWEVAPAPRTTAGNAMVAGGLTDLNDQSNVFLIPQGKPFYRTTYANFAPRIGLGWQLFSGPSKLTVLRAGAGRFFSAAQGGFEDNADTGSVSTIYDNPPLKSPFTGTPSSQTVTPSLFAVAAAPHYRLPVTNEWNVTIEQVLGTQTLSIGYVAALGRRLIGDIATLPLTDTSQFLIHLLGNDASSSYHSMQIQFNRRLPGKVQILASYTWSHSIDNLSNDIQPPIVQRTLAEYLNPNIDRGSSDFDVRHSLNGAVIAQLPSPRRGVWAAVLGRWSATSIFFARSALPTDILEPPAEGIRPDYVYGAPLYLYGSQYPGGKRYNPTAFVDAVPGQIGNLGRNVVRGFGAWQIDFALHREIKLSESTRLQLRAEVFNVLNHPNFANPSDPTDPSGLGRLFFFPGPRFGVSTQMLASGLGPLLIPGELNPIFQIGGPRVSQLALRLIF